MWAPCLPISMGVRAASSLAQQWSTHELDAGKGMNIACRASGWPSNDALE